MIISDALEVIRTRLELAADVWHVGADKLAEHRATTPPLATPRYVWVPTMDRFLPPERLSKNPRVLLTRLAGLELHLWADDQDDAETRLLDVIVAWLAEANTSVAFEKANWHTDSLIGRGVLVTLNLTVKIPVTAATKPTAQATTIEPDTSDTAQGDGFLDNGETT